MYNKADTSPSLLCWQFRLMPSSFVCLLISNQLALLINHQSKSFVHFDCWKQQSWLQKRPNRYDASDKETRYGYVTLPVIRKNNRTKQNKNPIACEVGTVGNLDFWLPTRRSWVQSPAWSRVELWVTFFRIHRWTVGLVSQRSIGGLNGNHTFVDRSRLIPVLWTVVERFYNEPLVRE